MTLLLLLDASGTTIPATLPTVDEVAALLHARTNVMGRETGTFSDQTRPTDDQVRHLIDLAAADLAARVGNPLPIDVEPDVRRLAALKAAALVEMSFFPQQLDSDQSAYRQATADYLSGVDALRTTVRRTSGIVSLPVTTLVAQSSSLLTDVDLLP